MENLIRYQHLECKSALKVFFLSLIALVLGCEVISEDTDNYEHKDVKYYLEKHGLEYTKLIDSIGLNNHRNLFDTIYQQNKTLIIALKINNLISPVNLNCIDCLILNEKNNYSIIQPSPFCFNEALIKKKFNIANLERDDLASFEVERRELSTNGVLKRSYYFSEMESFINSLDWIEDNKVLDFTSSFLDYYFHDINWSIYNGESFESQVYYNELPDTLKSSSLLSPTFYSSNTLMMFLAKKGWDEYHLFVLSKNLGANNEFKYKLDYIIFYVN